MHTVVTVISEQAGLNLASELLGHTDPKVTYSHNSTRLVRRKRLGGQRPRPPYLQRWRL